MRQDPTVKAAQILAKKEISLARIELARDLVKNPILELIAGFVLVESLQRYPSSRPIIGNLQGNALEGLFAGVVTVQQLAPSLPYLTQAAGQVLGALGKAAPVLGAL